MNIYFQTKQRDGQSSKNQFQLFASTMEEAIADFSEGIIRSIAEGNDYAYYSNKQSLKQDMPDYKYQGEGYYLLPDSLYYGRELYYSPKAQIESYREDVYRYAISEQYDEVGGIGIN